MFGLTSTNHGRFRTLSKSFSKCQSKNATYISQFVPANPLIGDALATTQNHLTLIKSVLQATFPNANAPITATPTQLNTAATAFSGGAFTVPQNGTNGAEIIFTPAATKSTYSLQTVSNGLVGVSQGTNGTPFIDFASDGAGDFAATTSINAPTILENGYPLVPRGVIMLWHSTYATIPPGWAACDGTNGTPNLIGYYIVGANDLASGVASAGNFGGGAYAAGTIAPPQYATLCYIMKL